ncbi:MAG TPA: right-handed parallel beta-helix repeat-containing protein [Spirochaetia bacterium]|nr:right-handed parallel beta-helix repeat-containing protein [Spirochaetia bacterium]
MFRARPVFRYGLACFLLATLMIGSCRLFPPHQLPFDATRDLTAELPVFPGAEGFGSTTIAGRGGDLIRVTNLNASGPGSLEAALTANGRRTVIFEVGGIIELSNSIHISDPYLTVAGQTAPSPGITLTGAGIVVGTHDVLIQHIRVRPGDTPDGEEAENRDGISVVGDRRGGTPVYNVVIDHCSVSWAIDEGMSTWYEGVRDITFSNNLIAENLSESLHPKGEHSKGLLIGDHSRRISVIRNVFAHNMRRNPLLKGDTSTIVANNLIYNGGTEAIGFSDPEWSGRSVATIVGNLFIPGTDSAGTEYVWRGRETSDEIELFLDSNLVDDGELSEFLPSASIAEVAVGAPPVVVIPLTIEGTTDLEASVLESAGAFPADRDSVDARIVQSIIDRSGAIIDSQDDVDGYPAPTPSSRILTVPADPSGDDDSDGYTNLEEWLHSFAFAAETP